MLLKRLEQKPDDFLALADLGGVQLSTGKEKEAEENFQRALSLAEDKTIIYVKIANVYLNQQMSLRAKEVYLKARKESRIPFLFARELAQVYEASGETEKALEEYFHYYQEDNNRAGEVELIINSILEKEEKIPLVEKFLKRKIQENPQDYLAYQLLGEVYLEREEYEQALKIYESLDRILKAEGELVLSLAGRCLDKGQFPFAEQAVHYVLQKYSHSKKRSTAIFTLAEVHQKQNKFAEALEILNELQGAKADPRDRARALLLSGELCFQNRDFANSVSFYQTLLKESNSPQMAGFILLGLGNAYLGWGKSDSALVYYRQLLNPKPSFPSEEEINFRIGELFLFTEQFDSAGIYYEQITRKSLRSVLANDALERMRVIAENRILDPQGLSLYAQAQWLNYKGKLQSALSKFSELKKGSGSLPELAYIEEARIFQQEKDFRSSLQSLQELTLKYPESYYTPLAVKLSADLYSQELGQPALALELYQKILREYPQALFLDEVREEIKKLSPLP
jgi:tetratricopeptide (TPR) repeat protein